MTERSGLVNTQTVIWSSVGSWAMGDEDGTSVHMIRVKNDKGKSRAIASNLDEGAKIAIKKSALRHGKSYPVVRFWRFFPAEWQSSGE